MKGIFINCPNKQCKKILMKNVYLRPGSFLTTKCYWCGSSVEINSEPQKLILKVAVDNLDIDPDEENDIINISL